MKQILTLVFLASIAFTGFSQNKPVLDKVVATVGNQIILHSDIQSALMQLDVPADFDKKEAECFMLDQLLVHQMLLARAQFDSLVVPDEQVEQELNRRLRIFAQQIGGEQALEAFYKKSIQQIKDEFRAPVRDQLMAQQMEQKITRNVKITPSEVRSFFHSIPTDSLPIFNEAVEVGHIVRFVRPNEEERNAAIARLEEIRQRVLRGDNFRTLAILYSEDDGTASRGGNLGERGRGELEPEFAAAAFRLANDSISQVIETKHGFHIIQMVERRGEAATLRHILIRPRITQDARQQAISKLDSIYKEIVNDTLTFHQAAALFSEDRQTMNNGGLLFNPNTGSSRIPVDQMDRNLFFVIDTMEVGQVSQPVSFRYDDRRDAYRIVMLKSKIPAHRANLHDDYQQIMEFAMEQKRNERLSEWIDQNINRTYIRIDEDYRTCPMLTRWVTPTSNL